MKTKKSTLKIDLSENVRRNKFTFKGKYFSVSDYFKRGNIDNWWKPEEGKGNCGVKGDFDKLQKNNRRYVERWLKNKSFDLSLEIGPAQGRYSDAILSRSNKLTLVEINDKFVNGLIQKYDNNKRVKIIHDDITTLDLLKNIFDLVVIIEVLVHIEDIQKLMEKISMWCIVGGSIIVSITPILWYKVYKKRGSCHRGIDPEEFEIMLKSFGYKIEKKWNQNDKNGISQCITYFLKNSRESVLFDLNKERFDFY